MLACTRQGTCSDKNAVGDPRVLTAARIEVKSKFKAHQFLPADDPGTEQKIAEAREVARILRQNIVQGKQVSAEAGKGQRYREQRLVAERNPYPKRRADTAVPQNYAYIPRPKEETMNQPRWEIP